MLSKQQFERTRRLALSLAGIELVERHRELLHRRSCRLGITDSAGLDSLLNAAEEGEPTARRQFLRLLTTKFTGFFRQRNQLEIAAAHAQRVALYRGSARLWSAAAATGEEPYSLAMAMIEAFESDEPPVSILATDVDVEALETAKLGEYREAALRELDQTRRVRFSLETDPGAKWTIAPAPRNLVEFRPLNLTSLSWSVDGPFDVIFCRNVLMYLEACHRYAVLERIASLLASDGLLMLDPAEHPGKASHLFTSGADGVYSLRPKAHRGNALTAKNQQSAFSRTEL
jgi:chemotaxis protein methyltransferase CheR